VHKISESSIYTGYDTSHPDTLEYEGSAELSQHEHLDRDYAWRALGDHIAAGPGDVPQTVQARVCVNGRWIIAQARLEYIDLGESRVRKQCVPHLVCHAGCIDLGLEAPRRKRVPTRRVTLQDVQQQQRNDALAGRWALAGRVHRFAGDTWRTARTRAPQLTNWLDLRRHPWRAAATTSVAAGLALTAPDLLIGDPDFLAAAIEALVVYACFAALGGLLGLRGERPSDMRTRVEIATTT